MLAGLDPLQIALVVLAAMGAGFVNALAGGGTLISFPVLTGVLLAMGVPGAAVAANVTNTVALVPGYLGATFAQSRDLRGQRARAWILLPAAAIGGAIGGLLLLNTGEKLFRALFPFLILGASGLLALQDPVRRWVTRRADKSGAAISERWAALPVALAAVYGGYFGAGLSVIVLAVLGLTLEDSLTRLNALKQFIAFTTNVTAAAFFVFSGMVVWPVALVMAAGALAGGAIGGRLAGRVKPAVLRWVVVTIGLVVGIAYLVR